MFNEEHQKETLGELPADQHESEFPPGSRARFKHPSEQQNLTREDKRVAIRLKQDAAGAAGQLPVEEKSRNILILFFEWVKRFGIKTYFNSSFNTFLFNAELRSTLALAYNENRNYLIVQNKSAASIFIDFDKDANNTSLEIIAGGNYEPIVAPRNNINIIGASGDQKVTVVEGTK